jgi:hypothetical protein
VALETNVHFRGAYQEAEAEMRWTYFLVPLLLVAPSSPGTPPPFVPIGDAHAGVRILSMLPPQRLHEISPAVIDAVLRGDTPRDRLAALLGTRGPVTAMGAPTDLQAKQFITHWLDHFICLGSGIEEDYVDEATIDGRCSGQPMSDGPSAPFLDPDYYANPSGAILTGYWQAPTDAITGAIRTTNVSRYFVTWVQSPRARSARVWLGASDYFKLWVNGALVLSRTAGGPKHWTVDEYKGNVALVAGWNLVVLKQSFVQLGPETDPNEDNKYKFFSLRFVSDDVGTPITDLVAAFNPNCTEADPSILTQAWVPNVAHLPGFSSQWRTDVYLFNGTHMNWLYRLRFYKEGNSSGVPDAETYVAMKPFQVLTFPDALQTLFGITVNTKGYIAVLQQLYFRWLSSPPSFGLQENGWLVAKTFNLSDVGTFGTLDPILLHLYGTSSPVTFFGLRNGAFRSNLALFPAVNAGATARIRVTLFGSDIRTPLSKEYVAIQGFWQINNVFDDLGAGGVSTDSASLHVDFLENPTNTLWFPYVTIMDGNPQYGSPGTSDPIYLAPGYLSSMPPDLN